MKLDINNSHELLKRVVVFRKSVFEKIEKRSPGKLWLKLSLSKVKKVIFINSAPRSGSSLLFSILRKIPGIYSLSGEGVPFYKLNGLSFGSFNSDEISPDTKLKPDVFLDLSRDFLSDLSSESSHNNIFNDNVLAEEYLDELVLRLPIQWPQISFSYDILKRLAMQAFVSYKDRHKEFCKEEFYLELFFFLKREYKGIDPYYYDLSAETVKSRFTDIKIPSGPPNNLLTIEEPPFIMLSPRAKIIEADIYGKTLLLKSSVDSYRMEFLRSLFPVAQIKTIQLVRNPLGSINGLCDGWLHRGFFSHNLRSFFSAGDSRIAMLKIAGYSELSAWGKYWWNYDLPPGWQEHIEDSLEEVCAFQWYSANRAIQEYLDNHKESRCLVRYENIVKGLASRRQEIEKIVDFIKAPIDCIGQLQLERLPVIQATDQPRPFRWEKRQGQLLPFLKRREIKGMCAQLGYDDDNIGEWF